MALFRYLGDPVDHDGQGAGQGPLHLTAFGVIFTKGQTSQVTDEMAVAKLSENSHFERVSSSDAAKEAAEAAVADADDDAPAPPAAPTGNGRRTPKVRGPRGDQG